MCKEDSNFFLVNAFGEKLSTTGIFQDVSKYKNLCSLWKSILEIAITS
jgi:uncharacterized protein YaaR (DUF327 family)